MSQVLTFLSPYMSNMDKEKIDMMLILTYKIAVNAIPLPPTQDDWQRIANKINASFSYPLPRTVPLYDWFKARYHYDHLLFSTIKAEWSEQPLNSSTVQNAIQSFNMSEFLDRPSTL